MPVLVVNTNLSREKIPDGLLDDLVKDLQEITGRQPKVSSRMIARTHSRAEITHFPMRCIIMACDAQGHRLNAVQVLMMHHVANVQFPHVYGFLLLSYDLYETSRQPYRNHTFQHTPFLHELCYGHGMRP